MTERSKIAPPRQRMSKIKNDMFDSQKVNSWKLRYHESRWRAAYREVDNEKGISPEALELIDIINAFIRWCNYSESARAVAYTTIARHVHRFDGATIKLWYDAIQKEYWHTHDADNNKEFARRFEESKHFHTLIKNTRCFYESYYLDIPRNVFFLTNAIRMTEARDRAGNILVFKSSERDMLYPHFNLFEEMDDRERLEGVGVLKLHHAWKTTDDSEKQKIKRFVTAYADQMDVAVGIVKSRYVDSLDHLEALMEGSSSAALSEGAL